MLNLNQLRVFYEAAKSLNFSVAASNLCITQPAVTAQVKLFEEYLDLKFFRKSGGKLHLTEAGQAVFERAAQLFAVEKDIELVIGEFKKVKRGQLRIGTARTYARYFMPFFISDFRQAFPRIQLSLTEGSSLEMIQQLLELKIEVALVAAADDHPALHFEPITREEVVLIAPPDHALSRVKSVTVAQAASQTLIMKESGSGTRRLVESLFEKYNLTPNVLMESSDAEVMKLLVKNGEGIAFLMRRAVVNELEAGTLVPIHLKGEKLRLEVSLAYLKGIPLSPPALSFVTRLKEWAAALPPVSR